MRTCAEKCNVYHMTVKNILPLILLLLVTATFVWLWDYAQNPSDYPIQHVSVVTKGQHINPVVLKQVISGNIHGSFFSLDTDGLRRSLSDNPWVEYVSIRRVWPNSLFVEITERQPLVRWDDNGVLSENGDVFYPAAETIPNDLPDFSAPLAQKNKILDFYGMAAPSLRSIGLSIQKLEVSDRLSWVVSLNNGIQVIICRDDVQNRFNRFITLYPKLIGNRAQDVVSVNLCYPNGLAIRWKDGNF